MPRKNTAVETADIDDPVEVLKLKVADIEDRLKWLEDNCKT